MSALTFRNVDVSPDDPVASWPQEAIQTALERGGLKEWSRIAEEIRSDPWGRVARGVEEVLTYSRPYGVAELMERVVAAARAAAEETERAAVATEVKELNSRSGLSRADFASRIGTSASRLSNLCNRKCRSVGRTFGANAPGWRERAANRRGRGGPDLVGHSNE